MTTRRQWLLGAAATAGALWMPSIVTRPAAGALVKAGSLRKENLPPPDFDALGPGAERVVGVRPHRVGGVRLERDPVFETAKGAKFVIHNYGHSGAGITLSWGCARSVVEHVQKVLNQMKGTGVRPSVAVLGSGVIGLTSATELRRKWPRLPITIYAKDLDVTKTTSYKAGGQFEPSQVYQYYEQPKKRRDTLAKYLQWSGDRIKGLQNSGRHEDFGVAERLNYAFDYPYEAFDCYTPRTVVPPYKEGPLPFAALNMAGREYRTWLMNPRVLLPRLVADLKRGGVAFMAKAFGQEQQIHDELKETIVVNCTGYGAKDLFGDKAMTPHRGHLLILKNPAGLRYFFSGGSLNNAIFYLFARQTDIVIGGTVQHNCDDRDDPGADDDDVFKRLLQNARDMFGGKADMCVDAFDGSLPRRDPPTPEDSRCKPKRPQGLPACANMS